MESKSFLMVGKWGWGDNAQEPQHSFIYHVHNICRRVSIQRSNTCLYPTVVVWKENKTLYLSVTFIAISQFLFSCAHFYDIMLIILHWSSNTY
jgi:hypothetical protein